MTLLGMLPRASLSLPPKQQMTQYWRFQLPPFARAFLNDFGNSPEPARAFFFFFKLPTVARALGRELFAEKWVDVLTL